MDSDSTEFVPNGGLMQLPTETMKSLFLVLLLSVLVLTGCSAGSSSGTTPTQPVLPAYIDISLSPSAVMPGQSATLTWSSGNATSCSSSGAWSGTIQASGSMTVMLQGTAQQSYTLTCTGAVGSVSKTVTLASPAESACAVSGAIRAHSLKRSAHRRKLTGSPS
jgi:hypothetical protein